MHLWKPFINPKYWNDHAEAVYALPQSDFWSFFFSFFVSSSSVCNLRVRCSPLCELVRTAGGASQKISFTRSETNDLHRTWLVARGFQSKMNSAAIGNLGCHLYRERNRIVSITHSLFTYGLDYFAAFSNLYKIYFRQLSTSHKQVSKVSVSEITPTED